MMKKLLTTLFLVTLLLPLLAQNPDFDQKYKTAKNWYEQGQYEKAKSYIKNTLKNLPALSSSQIEQGNRLAAQCDQAIAVRDRLDVSVEELNIPFGSGRDSVSFVAAKPNLVTAVSSAPAWCQVEKVENGKVFLLTQMNPNKVSRKADITIAMGKIKKRHLTVVQEARPETIKQVKISTRPNRGRLMVDNSMPSTGVWEGKLEAGSYRVRAEKSGYFPKDTVITVADDMRDNQLDFVIDLKPTFGRIKVDVQPQEGYSFNEFRPYTMSINGMMVGNQIYSYDDDRDIERYNMYEDGTIPVPAGRVSVIASADAFEPGQQDVQVSAGEIVSLSMILRARCGQLNLINAGQAADAQVSIDGKPVGTVQQITAYPLIIGEHAISLEKPGYVASEETYSINMKEDENIRLSVAMYRYVPYVFKSTPSDAQLWLNGEHIGNTPSLPHLLKEVEPNQSYELEIVKEGYLTSKHTITPDYDNPQPQTLNFSLFTTHKLTIASDKTNLKLYIKNKKDGDSTFVNGALLPAEVQLPLRETPYYLELREIGKTSAAYKKRLKFNDPDANQYNLKTWGNGFSFLSANYSLVGANKISVGNETVGYKGYKDMGTAQLVTFQLFPGLSTSAVRGRLFMQNEKGDFTGGTDSKVNVMNSFLLPAVSVLFINAEFRVGYTIQDLADVNVLASYAWYPNILKQVLGFSHVSGHDVFAGLELASRIRYINLAVKAGWQMYPALTANLYNKNGGKSEVKENYISVPMNIPGMFVVGVELSLGGKGKSILRVYY